MHASGYVVNTEAIGTVCIDNEMQNGGLSIISRGLSDGPSLDIIRSSYTIFYLFYAYTIHERRTKHLLMFMYSNKTNGEYRDTQSPYI